MEGLVRLRDSDLGRDVVLDGLCHSLARLIVNSSEYSVAAAIAKDAQKR